jgi:hypothetical protein
MSKTLIHTTQMKFKCYYMTQNTTYNMIYIYMYMKFYSLQNHCSQKGDGWSLRFP